VISPDTASTDTDTDTDAVANDTDAPDARLITEKSADAGSPETSLICSFTRAKRSAGAVADGICDGTSSKPNRIALPDPSQGLPGRSRLASTLFPPDVPAALMPTAAEAPPSPAGAPTMRSK